MLKGHIVRALARSTQKVGSRLFPHLRETVECDLLSNIAEDLPSMIEGCDAVVHIATSIPLNFTDANTMKANTRLRADGTKMLLAASLKAGARRYIQQSITRAYPGHGDNWITEDMPLDTSQERTGICAPVIAMEQMIQNIPLEDLKLVYLAWRHLCGQGYVSGKCYRKSAIR